jgi:glycogen debranching enzyme GlgX
LIAEAWDAAGLYQVGSFPSWGRWAEWNGKFRDDIRKFVKGDPGMVPALATRLAGSSDLYQDNGRRPFHSINFITCHDGFSLADLVSYNGKHNQRNGEDNRDGSNDNHSWNCGEEGPASSPETQTLRERQVRNFTALLLLAHGTPMLLAGDELGHSQQGNNNAYCQDNETTWIDWRLKAANQGWSCRAAARQLRSGRPPARDRNAMGRKKSGPRGLEPGIQTPLLTSLRSAFSRGRRTDLHDRERTLGLGGMRAPPARRGRMAASRRHITAGPA